jgi:4a-hydroxytetrahydrobiopterin dehydratase
MADWTRTANALTRTITFPSFPDAVTFVTRLGFYAESVDHHPDIHISYKKVTVTWTTHDKGGITDKDEAGANATDQLVVSIPSWTSE